MDQNFHSYLHQLPGKLQELQNCETRTGLPHKLDKLPNRAVYLFSDESRHKYVGRTNRLRARLKEHVRGRNNDAPFAFKVARFQTGNFRGKGSLTRKQLELDPIFSTAFVDAKKQVSLLQWQFVEIDDPNLQCLFEIYATIALDAEFNDFENH